MSKDSNTGEKGRTLNENGSSDDDIKEEINKNRKAGGT